MKTEKFTSTVDCIVDFARARVLQNPNNFRKDRNRDRWFFLNHSAHGDVYMRVQTCVNGIEPFYVEIYVKGGANRKNKAKARPSLKKVRKTLTAMGFGGVDEYINYLNLG